MYVPGALVPGTKVPENVAPPGAVQLPPPSGVPPSKVKRLKEASVLHTVVLALVPAFGATWTLITSDADAETHGEVPGTV